jgi:hypothetical protein
MLPSAKEPASQAVQQGHIGDIDKADRRRPGCCQSQPPLAQTIRQDQPQQIHRIADLTRTHKGLRLARRNVEGLYPAKTGDNARPVPIQKRFVSHSMLESQAIQRCNPILAPVGWRRHRDQRLVRSHPGIERDRRIAVLRDWRRRRCDCARHPCLCRFALAGLPADSRAGRVAGVVGGVRLHQLCRDRLRVGEHQ